MKIGSRRLLSTSIGAARTCANKTLSSCRNRLGVLKRCARKRCYTWRTHKGIPYLHANSCLQTMLVCASSQTAQSMNPSGVAGASKYALRAVSDDRNRTCKQGSNKNMRGCQEGSHGGEDRWAGETEEEERQRGEGERECKVIAPDSRGTPPHQTHGNAMRTSPFPRGPDGECMSSTKEKERRARREERECQPEPATAAAHLSSIRHRGRRCRTSPFPRGRTVSV